MKITKSLPFTMGELYCLAGMFLSVGIAYRAHPFAWPVWLLLIGWLLTPWTFRSHWGRGHFKKNKIKSMLAYMLITLVSVALATAFQLMVMMEQEGSLSGGYMFHSMGISVISISLMAMVSFDFRFERRGLSAAVLLSCAAGLLVLLVGMKLGPPSSSSTMPAAIMPIGLLFLVMLEALLLTNRPGVHSVRRHVAFWGVCLASAVALSAPVAILAAKVKHANYGPEIPNAPTSNRPVFSAGFMDKAPTDPYWRSTLEFPFLVGEYTWPATGLMDWRGPAQPEPATDKVEVYTYVMNSDRQGVVLDGTYTANACPKCKGGKDRNSSSVYEAYSSANYQYAGNVPPEIWYRRLSVEGEDLKDYLKKPNTPSVSVTLAQSQATMPRTFALVQQWRAEGLDHHQMIDRALAYFTTHLAYNFDYQSTDPAKNRVDYFLFESRRGVCRHFANAFAIMMRMAGIPSRIVVGFHGGEFDASSNIWTVRARDAHAWVEVWLDGKGWVRVDPTAAVPVEKGIPEEPPTLANKMGSWLEVEFPGMFSVAGSSMAGPIGKRLPPLGPLPKLLSILISGLLALWCIAMLIRRHPRRNQAHANDKAWDKLIATARRRGYAVPPAMGPASMGAQVSPSLPPALRARWSACMLRYERWKYGGHQDNGLADQLLALHRRLPKRVSSDKQPS